MSMRHRLASTARYRLMPGLLLASALVGTPPVANADVDTRAGSAETMPEARQAEKPLHVEFKAAAWPDVVAELSRTIGLRVHAAMPPAGPVTAKCVAADAIEVFRCVIGPSANLMVRRPSLDEGPNHSLEIWMLESNNQVGCSAGADRDGTDGTASPCTPVDTVVEKSQPDSSLQQSQVPVQTLLGMTTLDDPGQRAQSVAHLAQRSGNDDPAVNSVLLELLNDESAEVREQAIVGLVRRNDTNAREVLRQALRDPNEQVRAVAVEHITADRQGSDLLREALHDSDASIRAMAQTKLEQSQAWPEQP